MLRLLRCQRRRSSESTCKNDNDNDNDNGINSHPPGFTRTKRPPESTNFHLIEHQEQIRQTVIKMAASVSLDRDRDPASSTVSLTGVQAEDYPSSTPPELIASPSPTSTSQGSAIRYAPHSPIPPHSPTDVPTQRPSHRHLHWRRRAAPRRSPDSTVHLVAAEDGREGACASAPRGVALR